MRLNIYVIIALFAFGMTACGGGSKNTGSDSTETTEVDTAESESPDAGTETSEAPETDTELEATDTINLIAVGETMAEIAYEPNNVTAVSYTATRLNFENTAETSGMNHNAVIIPKDDKIAEEVRKSATGSNFDPDHPEVIAKTKMLLPGEKTSITFETPGPGEYYIICTYPGHQKMVATLVVE